MNICYLERKHDRIVVYIDLPYNTFQNVTRLSGDHHVQEDVDTVETVLPAMLNPGSVPVAVIRDIQASFVTKVIVVLFLKFGSNVHGLPN